jgi:hypothetical protein
MICSIFVFDFKLYRIPDLYRHMSTFPLHFEQPVKTSGPARIAEGGTPTNARHFLLATVFADVSLDVHFKRFARTGYQAPCSITSAHKKRYHNSKCEQQAVVERSRKPGKKKIERIKIVRKGKD